MSSKNTNDLLQVMDAWFDAPTFQEKRCIIQAHEELLTPECADLMQQSIAYYTDQPAIAERVRLHLLILREIQTRGGTQEAIRETFVNWGTGLSLDLPLWIKDLQQELNVERASQNLAQIVHLLQNALICAKQNIHLAAEISAELYYQLGEALVEVQKDRQQNLEAAIQVCKEALHVYTFARYPQQYARVQAGLGRVYLQCMALAQGENVEQQARICYEEALRVYTRDFAPEEWASIQINLGEVHRYRIRGNKRDNIEQALVCLRAALQIITCKVSSLHWAQAQMAMGNAYAERIADVQRDNQERAICCYEAAMQVFTSASAPVDWAKVQLRLVNVYSERIAGETRANQELSIACCEAALTVFTREAFPALWAFIQKNKGNVYVSRIEGQERANLEQAIDCYQQSLQIYTQDLYPLAWAKVHINLVNAYLVRIEGERSSNLEQVKHHSELALQIYTLGAFPQEWANIQKLRGDVYSTRIQGDTHENQEKAIRCFEMALQVYTPISYPHQWSNVKANLGSAYWHRLTGKRRENLEWAKECLEAALSVRKREAFPEEWAVIQDRLGMVYIERIEGEKCDNLELAIEYFNAALEVRKQEALPVDWARTKMNLGNAYAQSVMGDRRANVEYSIQYSFAALQVYTKQDFPQRWSSVQNNLGLAYLWRIEGEPRTNQEKAIHHFEQSLLVTTREELPLEWARIQLNLSNIYATRIEEEQMDNLRQAIVHGEAALQVYTEETTPFYWAMTHINLGQAYTLYRAGKGWRINLEEAIKHNEEALKIYRQNAFPINWAMIQLNLGIVYIQRNGIIGNKSEDLEQARVHGEAALQVFTRQAFPIEWAKVQYTLAWIYGLLSTGDPQANLKTAVNHCMSALSVRTIDALPLEYRRTLLWLINIEGKRQNWEAVYDACVKVNAVEKLLIELGSGTHGRDAILREGAGIASVTAFALARMGKVEEAIIALEQGRERSVAASLMMDAIDPQHIQDSTLRDRYIGARSDLKKAFEELDTLSIDRIVIEAEEEGILGKREKFVRYSEAYKKKKAQFDAIVAEIPASNDLAKSLRDTIDIATLQRAAGVGGAEHALVYLTATPWGGIAFLVKPALPGRQDEVRVAVLELPDMTQELIMSLFFTFLDNDFHRVIGGLGLAQTPYDQKVWSIPEIQGKTWREIADELRTYSKEMGRTGLLFDAVQAVVSNASSKDLIDMPVGSLKPKQQQRLMTTRNILFLQMELQRCMKKLGEVGMSRLVEWLQVQGVKSLTLIPGGILAAFPLTTILLEDNRTVSETLPTSVAPSGRSLLRDEERNMGGSRAGVYALGNPTTSHGQLLWSEEEAYALAKLARGLKLSAQVKVRREATRAWLLEGLSRGFVVSASCHGKFDAANFLNSSLILANGEKLKINEILHDQVNMRGLRLFLLSACQTAIADVQGAFIDEVHSLAAAMLQAGTQALIASLWSVDDKATYLLMTRFMYEWLPKMETEAPARALASAQRWLRTVTNQQLEEWCANQFPPLENGRLKRTRNVRSGDDVPALPEEEGVLGVRGEEERLPIDSAEMGEGSNDLPYAHPYYWAGFQVTGW